MSRIRCQIPDCSKEANMYVSPISYCAENVRVTPKPSEVQKPSHYTRGKIEVIDFILDQGLGFCLANVCKYICRAGHKDPNKHVEDLEKARYYLDKEIERVKKEKQ